MKKTPDAAAASGMTFRQAYEVLQRHAESLRNQDEPNIDDLLTLVEESVQAYKTCQKQIAAVEQALQKALTDMDEAVAEAAVDAPVAASTRKTGRTAKKQTGEPLGEMAQTSAPDSRVDDDLPF